MGSRLADYCDVVWQRTLDAAFIKVVVKATELTSAAPKSVEDMSGLFRLPRLLIQEAVRFAKCNAEACLRSRSDVPSMSVPAQWDAQRKADVEARVCRGIAEMVRLAKAHWRFSKQEAAVSQCAASTELLSELASQWEEGLRTYCKSLQKYHAVAGRGSLGIQSEGERKTARGRKGKRGLTAEMRLRELTRTEEGWRQILSAGTDVGVAALIHRKRGAVIRTAVWKKEIQPRFRMLREERRSLRRELDERRIDRYETD